ncbi:MAG: phosphoribosylformylglycinamidine cyclo-ligase [Candidatus Rokubacteria bacterium]|nr:phosphoribosylformylglycinamidine cyclo-ligase [Candidatus Rokubacteria bacterium]
MRPLTYRESGVDIDAGEDAVRRIAPLAATTARPEVLGGVGAFASFVRLPAGYREPVLVSSTDGVGSKLKVAFLAGRHDTVGIDLVAMGVNDVLVHGAEPLYFLDYIGMATLDPARVEAIVRGVAAGCRLAGCALVGGETAELPDLYAAGDRALLEAIEIRAMAHITGGGLPGNLPRVLPEGCRARLSRSAWRVPPVFETLREAGRVAEAEMFRTFNMGIGYVVVVAPTAADAAARLLAEAGETVWRVGEIVAGGRAVEFVE